MFSGAFARDYPVVSGSNGRKRRAWESEGRSLANFKAEDTQGYMDKGKGNGRCAFKRQTRLQPLSKLGGEVDCLLRLLAKVWFCLSGHGIHLAPGGKCLCVIIHKELAVDFALCEFNGYISCCFIIEMYLIRI